MAAYIPEKFYSKNYDKNSMFVLSLWTDGKNDIRLKQMPIKNTEIGINTENENYKEAVFGTQPVYYTIKYNTFNAVWHTEDYVFNFTAPYDLGLEEIEKIITSIALDG